VTITLRDRYSMQLWVDAACINQGNGPERSSQVGLMSQIYGRAVAVLAWLGEEKSGLNTVLGLGS
jgi:hypothetical protein